MSLWPVAPETDLQSDPESALVAARGSRRGARRTTARDLAFDRRADSYARFAVVQHRLAAWLAEWLEPADAAADVTALELGAGDGLFTRFLAPRYAPLTAVDIAPRMVDEGRRGMPCVAWRVADAWQLDGEPVDRLFSASLLHWCHDPVAVLRRWRRLTRPGGRMLHGFYVAPTLAEWQSLAAARSPVEWRSPTQWIAYFREAGWSVLRNEAQTRVERFASALDLFRFLHHTGAVAPRRTPVASFRRMIADYDRNFRSTPGGAAVASTWTFFRIEAVND